MTPLGVSRAALLVAARSSCALLLQRTHYRPMLDPLVSRILRPYIASRIRRALKAGLSAGLEGRRSPLGLRAARRHMIHRSLLPLMTDEVSLPEAFDKQFYRLYARCSRMMSVLAYTCCDWRTGRAPTYVPKNGQPYARVRPARREPVARSFTRRNLHRPHTTRCPAMYRHAEPTPRRPSRATRRRNARAARWHAFCNRRAAAAAEVPKPSTTAHSANPPRATPHRPRISGPSLRGDANVARAGVSLVACLFLWVLCGCLSAPVGTEQLLFDFLCWGAFFDPFRCGRRLFQIRAHGSFGFSLDPRWDQTPDIHIMHV